MFNSSILKRTQNKYQLDHNLDINKDCNKVNWLKGISIDNNNFHRETIIIIHSNLYFINQLFKQYLK